MFHDPDFLPFTPRATPSFLAVSRNFLENYPTQAYRSDYWTSEGFLEIVPRMHYVASPALIEELLVSRADAFRRDEVVSRALAGPVERDSLFFSEGAEWKWQRRALSPAFRHENILALVPHFSRCAQAQAQEWRDLEQGASVDIMHAMSRTTFAVIEKAVYGAAEDFDRDGFIAALRPVLGGVGWRMLAAMFHLPPDLTPYPGFLAARRATRFLRAETHKLLAARRAVADDRRDILGLMLSARDPETGRALDDSELVANIHGFLLAGHETAAVALAWSLWLLAKDQESQQRLREEVCRLCGDAEIGADTVETLAFTRQVLQESMRLFPPAAAIGRQARADTTLGPHHVRANEPIYIITWCLHRNETLWDEPLGFDPDRFAPDKVKARPRYAFLPFGAGPRICVGMGFAMLEMTAILATLVRAFRFETAPGHRLELAPSFTTRPKGALPLRVTRLDAKVGDDASRRLSA
ncbi:cytochrome P450 [Methylosinus trichosporium]|uniref:Cytochrome P450 n=2 Tax=Methylosinus TaxID=425 RepID=A0A2D2D2T4_METT3|nr:cytochrome P450 [Methylosinus trichosporium]ATQ69311.1 cytochrome P450 [Methylosinus trichosporium OB3b]